MAGVYGGAGDDENGENKRRSKVGLSLLMHHYRPVHFALDLLDMDQVTAKSYPGETATKRIITNAELRFVFRHRDNEKVKSCIQFWLNKVAVVPPWDEASEIYVEGWNTYETHLGSKQPQDRMALNLSTISLTGDKHTMSGQRIL
jgi:hypothetical protein